MSDSTSTTNKHSTSTSVDLEFKLIKVLKQIYTYEWSKSLEHIKDKKLSTKLTVEVPPGQRAILKHWRGQFGDVEVFNKVEYETESCLKLNSSTYVAIARETLLKERENCSPDAPELKVRVTYNRGIIMRDNAWHLSDKPLAAAPELINSLHEAIRSSTQLGQWAEYWRAISLQVS